MKSRMNFAEAWISDMEDRIKEIIQSEQQTESKMKKKNKSNVRDLWHNIKCINLCIIGLQKKKKWIEKGFEEIMTEKFSNLKKYTLTKNKEGNRNTDTRSTEGSKQAEPKETYTNM